MSEELLDSFTMAANAPTLDQSAHTTLPATGTNAGPQFSGASINDSSSTHQQESAEEPDYDAWDEIGDYLVTLMQHYNAEDVLEFRTCVRHSKILEKIGNSKEHHARTWAKRMRRDTRKTPRAQQAKEEDAGASDDLVEDFIRPIYTMMKQECNANGVKQLKTSSGNEVGAILMCLRQGIGEKTKGTRRMGK